MQCLANLHQIGHGIQMYAAANRGAVTPASYWGLKASFMNPDGADWASILVHGRYLPGPTNTDGRSSIFRCPSGSDSQGNWWARPPASPWDPWGAQPSTNNDQTNREVMRTWYAVNCSQCAPVGLQPFQLLPIIRDDGSEAFPMMRMDRIHNSSRMVFVFDGLSMLWNWNPCYINARHKNHTVTNLLMADGHAEGMSTKKVLDSWYVDSLDKSAHQDLHWYLDESWLQQ